MLTMSRVPDYTHNVSLRMSQVMDDIGVNEKIVMKRRKLMLALESINTLSHQIMDRHINVFFFGSQTEGTTTQGLNSDTDCLFTNNRFNVAQDLSELEHGKQNLLMIQDETVSPGYCMLQVLGDDVLSPAVVEMNEHLFRDERGRILLRNTFIDSSIPEFERHGPAQSQQSGPGFNAIDNVAAFTCQSYPVQARHWLDQHIQEYWPSNDMIQYCYNIGCFVVGVGNKGSENEILEWRLSTSLAERCFMYNLNITQTRCYVLMKMIMKTFITPRYPESISSFMCKTVLFHCISNTKADEWKENTLLICLSFCLSTLYNRVLNEYCPHFLIPENNLLIRRVSQEHKSYILETLYHMIQSNGKILIEIKFDEFGLRLQHRLSGSVARNMKDVSTFIAGKSLWETALSYCCKDLFCEIRNTSSENAVRLVSSIMLKLINTQHPHLASKCVIAKHLCHTMGTILASQNIYRRNNLTYKALPFMSLGLNSDVASTKLKLASVFYSIWDTERTELFLKNIEEIYDLSFVEPICDCYFFEHSKLRERFSNICYESNEEYTLIKNMTASCVRFIQCEANCCPQEFLYEMFRSTQEDLAYRTLEDKWMDMAVVDSLPYLYFLQYKTYVRLGRQEERRNALSNLVRTIWNEPNLGHRETALNLLGQCMEIEQCPDDALKCYLLSLKLRSRNNVAKYHICMLLNILINGHERSSVSVTTSIR